MLLCPESEQFNPGKVFMFFRKQENYGIFAASDGKFTAAAYIVSNHIDNDFQQSYTENRYCAIAVIKYFSVHTLNPLFRERHGVRFSRDGNFSVSTAKIVSVAHIAATG